MEKITPYAFGIQNLLDRAFVGTTLALMTEVERLDSLDIQEILGVKKEVASKIFSDLMGTSLVVRKKTNNIGFMGNNQYYYELLQENIEFALTMSKQYKFTLGYEDFLNKAKSIELRANKKAFFYENKVV